jgi:hypothetical protein
VKPPKYENGKSKMEKRHGEHLRWMVLANWRVRDDVVS